MNSDSPIRVGSDCSGWGSEVFALKMLGLNVDHRFACDVAQHSKTFIFNNCKPKVWYENCMIRNNQKTPSVDVYVAGFPCQPFSSAGKNKGLRDDRGTVFDGIYDYIRHQKPKIFVLENVKNLVSSKHKSTFHAILKLLGGLKCPENPKNTMYLLTWNIYNSKHFGVPQNRERLYIVGLRRSNIVKLDWVRHNKKFTDMMNQCVMETPDIRNFLGQLKEKTHQAVEDNINMHLRSAAFNNTAKKNLRNAMSQIRAAKLDLSSSDIVVDLANGFSRTHLMYNMCPTITRTRGAREDFYLMSTARRLSVLDYMRLQGLDPDQTNLENLLYSEIGQLAGNAMTIPLLASILRASLVLSGLAKDNKSSTSSSSRSPMSLASRSSMSSST